MAKESVQIVAAGGRQIHANRTQPMIKHFLIYLIATLSVPSFASNTICKLSISDDCFTQPFPPIASSAPLDVFDHTSELVAQCFYDPKFHGANWKEESSKARSWLSNLSSQEEVSRVINSLLAKLRASHTEFLTHSDQRYWSLKSIFTGDISGAPLYHIGAVFERSSGRWFVQSILEKSPAFLSGLKSGDEILSVSGKPLLPVDSFFSGKPVQIKFRRRPKGPLHTITVRPTFSSFPKSMFDATLSSRQIFTINGKKIGYFRLWAGTHDLFKEALATTAHIMENKADALILDIRDGLGGASPDFLDPFFKPSPPIFSKPVYLLINEGSKSGKESLAFVMKTSGRATLIGKNTAGYYLGGRLFDIVENKYSLYLAICGDSPVGVPLEGIGVAPDIEVFFSLPYSHGQDLQLQRALEIASH